MGATTGTLSKTRRGCTGSDTRLLESWLRKSAFGSARGWSAKALLVGLLPPTTDSPQLAMPKLKNVLGKRPRLSSECVVVPASSNPPRGSTSASLCRSEALHYRGSLGEARRLARSSADACAEALVIEADASTSRASLKCQLKTWDQIAKDAGFQDPFSLTPNLVFTVVGVLKQAGYTDRQLTI